MSTRYQYMSFDKARYILRNKCLPLSHFSRYNDPYECSIEGVYYEELKNIVTSGDYGKIQNIVTKVIEDKSCGKVNINNAAIGAIATSVVNSGLALTSPISLIGALVLLGGSMKLTSKFLNKADSQTVNKIEKYMKKFLLLSAETYTSCFSTTNDNLLMWSHYADSHKGVVIGFRINQKPFKDNPPLRMKYSQQRFILDEQRICDNDVWEYIKSILLTKSNKWRYENECRFIFDGLKNKDLIIWYDHNDNPVIKLSNEAIDCVYIGARVSSGNEKMIKNIIETQYSNEIITKKAKLCHTGFGIEFLESC